MLIPVKFEFSFGTFAINVKIISIIKQMKNKFNMLIKYFCIVFFIFFDRFSQRQIYRI